MDQIAGLFPGVITEARAADGSLTKAVDFDLLRQELSGQVVEGHRERYQLDWPGKREALFAANAPVAKTLRPVRDASVGFDTTRNLFIEGDNLDALKLLQESYVGKVRLIYIDPPYNTGNDFVYADDFAATDGGIPGEIRAGGFPRQPARGQPRDERPLPLRLAEHDVPAAQAGAQPARGRRGDLRQHRLDRARQPRPAAQPS